MMSGDRAMTAPKDRIVIVTGAGRGIGEAAAHRLAAEGAQVVVAARSAPAAGKVADAIAADGGAATTVACDVTDFEAVSAAVRDVVARFGRVDALVNNAGVIEPIGRLADIDPQAWGRTIETNLIGAYFVIRAVLPAMLRQGQGTIVNLSSGAAFRPLEGWSAYCCSKAGLAMLTRAVDHEYASRGIRSVGLLPGVVDTGMQSRIRATGINPVSKIPRENLSPVAEPAQAIAWLCRAGAADYAGKEIDIGDPAFRLAAGLPPLAT